MASLSKKTLLAYGLALGLAGLVPCTAAFAAGTASVILSDQTLSFQQGQTTTVHIAIDPKGMQDYTAKIEVTYPSNLLSVTSFDQASGWISIAPSGYDSIDNAGGTLIKTAGYPKGISGATDFGTITFMPIGTGSGTISVLGSGSSIVLDATSDNVLDDSSLSPLSFSVTPAPATPATDSSDDTATPPDSTTTVPPDPSPSSDQPTSAPSGTDIAAAAGDASPLPFSPWTVGLAAGGLLVVGALILIWRNPSKK